MARAVEREAREARAADVTPAHPVPERARARPGSWATLAAYVALVCASHALWVSFASVTSAAARAYHTGDVSIGLLVSVGPLCSAALSIPAGVLPDRIGYRRPLLVAGAATALFAFLRPLAGGFPLLLVLTVAMLLPQPFLINAVADLVNRHFPEGQVATATGIGTMAIFLGITIGVALTPVLVDAVGVRGSQVVYAALALAALVAFALAAPRRVPERMSGAEGPSVRTLRRALRSRTLWRLSAIIFCGFGFYIGMTTWLEEIVKPRGIGATQAGLVAGSITAAGIVGSVTLGALSDRLRRRRPFLVAGALIAAPALWLLGHLASFGGLEVTAAVLGFFLIAALPVAIAMISEDATLGPTVASTAVGVVLLFGNLGGAIVVAVMGAMKSAQGSFSGSIVLLVAMAVLAGAIAAPPFGGLARPARRAE